MSDMSASGLPPDAKALSPGAIDSGNHSATVVSSKDAEKQLAVFEKSFLGKSTNAKLVYFLKDAPVAPQPRVGEIELSDTNFSPAFQRLVPQTASSICFIQRQATKHGTTEGGERRLGVSTKSFRWLLSHRSVPPNFIATLIKQNMPSGWSCYIPERVDQKPYVCWYIIPVRVPVECTNTVAPHALSEAGSSQNDPSNYLHLQDLNRDIRPSILAMFYDQRVHDGGESAVCINFQDGRWPFFVNEPSQRMKDAFERAESRRSTDCRFMVHLVLFSSAAGWWSQTLESFNRQVIEYEQHLIRGPTAPNTEIATFLNEINTALHTMASHLHRYRAEIETIEQSFAKISRVIQGANAGSEAKDKSITQTDLQPDIHFIATRFQSLRVLIDELDGKLQAVLALLFHLKQISHMQMLIDNGQSLRSLMESARDEARSSRRMAAESQAMARAMQKDSVSMKTLALVSVLFLPGATFAAILSMPFFTTQPWLNEPGKIWLWLVLTVPTTIAAVVVYVYLSRKGTALGEIVDVEMDLRERRREGST